MPASGSTADNAERVLRLPKERVPVRRGAAYYLLRMAAGLMERELSLPKCCAPLHFIEGRMRGSRAIRCTISTN
jgi:hypothetical protein